MKKTLILTWLMLCYIITMNAQQSPIDGFWGIKFGSSKAYVSEAMLAKPGCKLTDVTTNELDENLWFSGADFAGSKPEWFCFTFLKDKLISITVLIAPLSQSGVFNLYNELSDGISLKYGVPTKTAEVYSIPFEKGDGHELLAIQSEKANISKIWRQTTIKDGKESFFGKIIFLTITKSAEVSLIYYDEGPCELVSKLNKAKNSKDL